MGKGFLSKAAALLGTFFGMSQSNITDNETGNKFIPAQQKRTMAELRAMAHKERVLTPKQLKARAKAKRASKARMKMYKNAA